MLRLLRNFRRNLFGSLGTRKYILYAAGEVVLIVIGVLLALQLNNWNNFRILRIQEKQVLVRLNEELESSLKRISMLERSVQKKKQALIDLEPYFQGQPIEDPEAFLKTVILASTFGWEQPLMEQTTFEEIISTGRLSLIRDINLRLSITRFFHITRQREHRSEVRITEFPKITYRYIPITEQNQLQEGLSEERIADAVENILKSDLRAYVLPELNRSRFILSIWDQTKEQGTELLNRIMEVRGMESTLTDLEARIERQEAIRNERRLEAGEEVSEDSPRPRARQNQE